MEVTDASFNTLSSSSFVLICYMFSFVIILILEGLLSCSEQFVSVVWLLFHPLVSAASHFPSCPFSSQHSQKFFLPFISLATPHISYLLSRFCFDFCFFLPPDLILVISFSALKSTHPLACIPPHFLFCLFFFFHFTVLVTNPEGAMIRRPRFIIYVSIGCRGWSCQEGLSLHAEIVHYDAGAELERI